MDGAAFWLNEHAPVIALSRDESIGSTISGSPSCMNAPTLCMAMHFSVDSDLLGDKCRRTTDVFANSGP